MCIGNVWDEKGFKRRFGWSDFLQVITLVNSIGEKAKEGLRYFHSFWMGKESLLWKIIKIALNDDK
jgi:hypothetical protein